MLKYACLDKYFVSKQMCYEAGEKDSNTSKETLTKQYLFNM